MKLSEYFFKNGKEQASLWHKSQSENNVESYKAYLVKYPKGKYAKEAEKCLLTLTKQAEAKNNILRIQEEKKAALRAKLEYEKDVNKALTENEIPYWENVLRENNLNSYINYIQLYPGGKFIELAIERAQEFRKHDITVDSDITINNINAEIEEHASEYARVYDLFYNYFLKLPKTQFNISGVKHCIGHLGLRNKSAYSTPSFSEPKVLYEYGTLVNALEEAIKLFKEIVSTAQSVNSFWGIDHCLQTFLRIGNLSDYFRSGVAENLPWNETINGLIVFELAHHHSHFGHPQDDYVSSGHSEDRLCIAKTHFGEYMVLRYSRDHYSAGR